MTSGGKAHFPQMSPAKNNHIVHPKPDIRPPEGFTLFLDLGKRDDPCDKEWRHEEISDEANATEVPASYAQAISDCMRGGGAVDSEKGEMKRYWYYWNSVCGQLGRSSAS
jgi:glucose-6-phosphate 1-dehydrogenase